MGNQISTILIVQHSGKWLDGHNCGIRTARAPPRNSHARQIAKAHADAVAEANQRVSTVAEEAEVRVTEARIQTEQKVEEAAATANRRVAEAEDDASRRISLAIQDAEEKTKDADRRVARAEEASPVLSFLSDPIQSACSLSCGPLSPPCFFKYPVFVTQFPSSPFVSIYFEPILVPPQALALATSQEAAAVARSRKAEECQRAAVEGQRDAEAALRVLGRFVGPLHRLCLELREQKRFLARIYRRDKSLQVCIQYASCITLVAPVKTCKYMFVFISTAVWIDHSCACCLPFRLLFGRVDAF